jgi:hypothetical protein
MNRMIATVMTILLLATSAGASINNWDTGRSNEFSPVVDVLLFRPVGIGLTLAGGALCVVMCSFATLTPNGAAQTANQLVLKPLEFTFVRPVGIFPHTSRY